jgi:hypothetical protein
MPKLTKRKIDAAEVQEKEYFIWDDTPRFRRPRAMHIWRRSR